MQQPHDGRSQPVERRRRFAPQRRAQPDSHATEAPFQASCLRKLQHTPILKRVPAREAGGTARQKKGDRHMAIPFPGINLAASYSPTRIPHAVPSALRSLTTEFGMGSGVAFSTIPPEVFERLSHWGRASKQRFVAASPMTQ